MCVDVCTGMVALSFRGERERKARKKRFLKFSQRRVTDTHVFLSTRDQTDDKCTSVFMNNMNVWFKNGIFNPIKPIVSYLIIINMIKSYTLSTTCFLSSD